MDGELAVVAAQFAVFVEPQNFDKSCPYPEALLALVRTALVGNT